MSALNGTTALAPTLIERRGMGYWWAPEPYGVAFQVSQLRGTGEDLRGYIDVTADVAGRQQHLHGAFYKIAGATTAATLRRNLDEQAGAGVPWQDLIRQFLRGVHDAERQGEPFLNVADMPAVGPPRYLVENMVLASGASCFFGPGATGKGWITMTLALCVAMGHPFAGHPCSRGAVLYLDWEDTWEVFKNREQLIRTGLLQQRAPRESAPVIYRHMVRPLGDDVEAIADVIAQERIVLVVIDSVEAAMQGASSYSNHNDRASDLHRALRYLDTAALLIDHVSDEGRRSKERAGKPINGIMKVNAARCMWELRKEEEAGDEEEESHVGLYHAKANHGKTQTPFGLRLDWSHTGEFHLEREPLSASPELTERASLIYRITTHLHEVGTDTCKGIATALDVPLKSIQNTMPRGKTRGQFVEVVPGHRGRGATGVWGLRA